MDERRRDERVAIDIAVSFYVKGQSRERRGLGKNISVGGMHIETATPATYGAEVDVYVALPRAEGRVRCPGIVRWVKGGAMGVQFLSLGAKETHLITELSQANR